MKKILLFLTFASWLFAVDATISVVNKGMALPKIVLQDATTAVGDQTFKGKFHKIMLGDLILRSWTSMSQVAMKATQIRTL